jgi:hypothetical protein
MNDPEMNDLESVEDKITEGFWKDPEYVVRATHVQFTQRTKGPSLTDGLHDALKVMRIWKQNRYEPKEGDLVTCSNPNPCEPRIDAAGPMANNYLTELEKKRRGCHKKFC